MRLAMAGKKEILDYLELHPNVQGIRVAEMFSMKYGKPILPRSALHYKSSKNSILGNILKTRKTQSKKKEQVQRN